MHLLTDRLTLHSITPDEARRIIARTPGESDHWHPEYPLEDELVPLSALAKQATSDNVFGLYMISTRDDALAVGGIGFFGPPDSTAAVEVGYGLIEAARGKGYAAEALHALMLVARDHGAATITADTFITNLASQNVLIKAGFRETRRSAESIWYLKELL